ncbi:MAG: hypothetical protein ACR2G4_09360, partial [Pyrinomonadaceae bacterium]
WNFKAYSRGVGSSERSAKQIAKYVFFMCKVISLTYNHLRAERLFRPRHAVFGTLQLSFTHDSA